MVELWQSYGIWALYGLFFLAFLWLHGTMHGAHSGHRGARDDAPGQSHNAPKGHNDGPARQSAQESSESHGWVLLFSVWQSWLMVRLRWRNEHESWMMMSGFLALCALVVVAVLIPPIFGAQVAGLTAVVAVTGIVLVCYLVCVPRALARLRGFPRDI